MAWAAGSRWVGVGPDGGGGGGGGGGAPLPWGHVRGGLLSSVSGLTFNVGAFEARDQANSVNIISGAPIAMNLATEGAGGKDYSGATLSSATVHCLYAIWGSSVAVSCIASLNWSAPTLPSGYTHYVCIGFLPIATTSALYGGTQNIQELGSGLLYPLVFNLGTAVVNAVTTVSIANFVNVASGRFKQIIASIQNNSTGAGACSIRVSGTAYIQLQSATLQKVEGIVPLVADSVDLFSSAATIAGTGLLKGIYFERGAK